ncbi:MAG TPA: hypothetical protein P5121_00670 [Caldilineaceae bacterium]|nr:hypothetical protein [Caldilineaceae bacterium]
MGELVLQRDLAKVTVTARRQILATRLLVGSDSHLELLENSL